MKYHRKKVLVGALGLLMAVVIGCATSRRTKIPKLDFPPGLDSTTVVLANSVADNSFVSPQQERDAELLTKEGERDLQIVDEFWAYLEQRVKKDNQLTSTEREQFVREYAQGEQSLAYWNKIAKNATDKKLSQEALNYCLQAQKFLERAIRINPFDKNARILLAMAYYNLQHIFGMQNNYQKAIDILERLTRIEKGEHELFRLLGENYMALKNFESAAINFHKAQIVFNETSFETPPDTSLLFYYSYVSGDAYARMYDAEQAVKSFRTAATFARTAQEKTDVDNYLAWINFDGGNIRASELWDEIVALETEKNYPAMAGLCTKLLPLLKTKKARLNVTHKLAVVEFEFLGLKAGGIERMQKEYDGVRREIRTDGKKEYQQFLDTYGAMLYRLGMEARDEQKKKLALAYFTKSISFKWEQMAKVYIELVTLLWNNHDKAIEYGKKALASSNGLSEKETSDLLSLMVRAHKSAGLFDEARVYFNKWKTYGSKQ